MSGPTTEVLLLAVMLAESFLSLSVMAEALVNRNSKIVRIDQHEYG